MYPNQNALKLKQQKNTWHPEKKEKDSTSYEKSVVVSICPKCNIRHNVFMIWAGRGIPRKFCTHCKNLIDGYDDIVLSEPSVFSAGTSRKRARSSISE